MARVSGGQRCARARAPVPVQAPALAAAQGPPFQWMPRDAPVEGAACRLVEGLRCKTRQTKEASGGSRWFSPGYPSERNAAVLALQLPR